MAAGLVKQIQAGCDLYKQAKESFVEVKKTADDVTKIYKEVTGFWSNFRKLFGSKPKPQVTKPVAKKKETFVAVDETQVKVDIVKNLTEFFRLQEQLAAHIREEEEKSLTVYDPDQNHMEAALKRVMAQQEMDRLVIQIRECMVYQSPPEMGALYSEVFSMKDKIEEEQTQARLRQEAIKRQEQWLRKEEERNLQAKLGAVVVTSIFLLYLWMWFVFVSHWGKK
jgi:Fe2+ transport system protein B